MLGLGPLNDWSLPGFSGFVGVFVSPWVHDLGWNSAIAM